MTEELLTQEYKIPESNIPALRAKIDELAKRAKRLKLTPITMEEGEIISEVSRGDDGEERVKLFVMVKVTGRAPKINGWTFIATLEHLEEGEGNIVRAVPGMVAEGELIDYRSVPPWCAHCKTIRLRNNTYLVRHDGEAEIKQVGSSCLKDFLGHGSPHAIASEAEIWGLLGDTCSQACDDDWGMGGGGMPYLMDLEIYLRWVSASIRKWGWVPRSKAWEDRPASADTAMTLMIDSRLRPSYELATVPDERDNEHAHVALGWIRDETNPDVDVSSDYMYNLITVCRAFAIPTKHAGLAASLFVPYDRTIERKARTAARAAVSGHVGTVGERVTLTLTCVRVTPYESFHGGFGRISYIHGFIDADGNEFTWFASNAELDPGKTYSIKGTVKDHSDFRGVKQTVLTHCKLLQEIDTTAQASA